MGSPEMGRQKYPLFLLLLLLLLLPLLLFLLLFSLLLLLGGIHHSWEESIPSCIIISIVLILGRPVGNALVVVEENVCAVDVGRLK